MNWIGSGWKRSWSNLRYYPGIYVEGLRKTMGTSVRILLLSLFRTLSISCFLSLINLFALKITFRRMDLPSSSGKKGETPVLLDPVDRAIPDLSRSIYRIQQKMSPFSYLKTKKDPSFET
jgi:hypothetical protein